jgi:parallel beta-helix repeat protein
VCDAGADRLRGILFDGASGSITNNNVTSLEQGPTGESGCQEGNAIDVRTSGTVTISGNTVSDYQKTGILATGSVSATITGNTVTGDGPIAYIAQNGIQISDGATAKVTGNTVSGNYYSPSKVTACGLLIFKAGGISASKNGLSYLKAENTFTGNETDICNFGKGGGFDPTV